ncbi:MAG: hypothetical protein QOH24_1944 [Verrucomicrobiota bacterium]
MINALSLSQTCTAIAALNPLAGADQQIVTWFHRHLSQTLVSVLHAFSEPGSSEWIGIVLFFAVTFFIWKRAWPALVTLIVAVPGGMLLNEVVKICVHRHRPFVDGWFVDWSGYSFASGHVIGATLLYGQLMLFLLPVLRSKRWRSLIVFVAAALVLLVGFSRIALGAHYLSDVLGAIFFGILWLAFCAVAGKLMRRKRVSPVVAADAPLNAR